MYKPNLRVKMPAITWLLAILLLTAARVWAIDTGNDLRQLLQLAEYIGVDYSEAVENGVIVDQGEFEEMTEFSRLIVDKSQDLPDSEPGRAFAAAALHLQAAVAEKRPLAAIQDITTQLRSILLKLSPQLSLPRSTLPRAQVVELFQQQCSGCHGLRGRGDGPLAAQLEPSPTDFTDKERAKNRSLMGLYDAIASGIDGTSMPTFSQLSEQTRWSLTFYVGGLAFETGATGAAPAGLAGIEPQQFVSHSPNTLAKMFPQLDPRQVERLRANPEALLSAPPGTNSPLALTRQKLNDAYAAYQLGRFETARNASVSAYLDGFELIENTLDSRDIELRKSIEAKLLNFRQLLGEPGNEQKVEQQLNAVLQQLQQAQELLSADVLSDAALFSSSFVILLREGLEALLVVIALVTVLIRTDRSDTLKYVHLGWTAALGAGVATWWAAQNLVTISGANREIMEGVAALLAAAVLFYVGFWMHSKTQAANWQAYIKGNIDRHLRAGTLWGIAGLAFIAVYREVFETVLFYQALLTQAAPQQYVTVSGGLLAGVAILAAITWIMIKYSIKLPLARFFSITTYLLLGLSFVLMGKAVSALQEAAVVDISPLPIKLAVDWLGIYPTWEGIISQLVILLLAVAMLFHYNRTAAT